MKEDPPPGPWGTPGTVSLATSSSSGLTDQAPQFQSPICNQRVAHPRGPRGSRVVVGPPAGDTAAPPKALSPPE